MNVSISARASRSYLGFPGILGDAHGCPKTTTRMEEWMFLTHQQFCEVVGVVGVADQLCAGDGAGVGQLRSYEHRRCCHQLVEELLCEHTTINFIFYIVF